ncbi:MAG: molybdopterin-dependent oxidoreductase [Candidatus Bathyarchaeota archaeon]|nr:molybdopterin-dependent oxidoreductase [Candidatus Bathyarchaeota archaeon]
MNKGTKIAIVAFVLLIIAAVPVYLHVRQNAGSEEYVQVKGAVAEPQNFTLSDLKAFEPVTVQVTLASSSHASENGDFTYKGVPVMVLLQATQASTNAQSVYFQAVDGYGTTIPIQDLQQNNQAILAYEKDDQPLTPLTDGGEGPIRLIIGTDQYAQRWTRGVASIDIRE